MSRTKIAQYYYNLGRQKAAQDMLGGRTKTAAKISPAMLKRLGIGAGVGAGVGGGAYGINKLLSKANDLSYDPVLKQIEKLKGPSVPAPDPLAEIAALTGSKFDPSSLMDTKSYLKQIEKLKGPSVPAPDPLAEIAALTGSKFDPSSLMDTTAARAAAAAEESRMVHEMIPNIIKMLGEHGPGQVSKSINDVVSKGLISPRAGRMYNFLVDDYRAMEPVTESLLKAKGAISPYFANTSSPFFPNAEVASRMDIQNKIMDSLSAPDLGLKNILPLPL